MIKMSSSHPLQTLIVLALTFALALVGVSAAGCREGPDRLVMGFVAPSFAAVPGGLPATQADILAEAATAALDIKVEVFGFPSSADLIRALGDGQADIAVFSPYAYVAAHEASGAQLLLKATTGGKSGTGSEIIASTSSGVEDLADLKGKVFGFVDPASPEGYLFPAAYLVQNGIISTEELAQVVFLGDAVSVLRAVAEGRVEAAACAEGLLEAVQPRIPDIKQRVAIIARTPPVPGTTVAVRAGLESRLADRIKQALLAVVNGEGAAEGEGRAAWIMITGTDGLGEAQEADYEVIRRMVETLGIDIEVLAAG